MMQMTKNKTTSTKSRFFWPLSKVMLGATGAFLLGGFLLLQTWAAPGDGPVVQYSFEDASNLGKDSSSAGNNATNYGVTQALGRVGKAGYFNGSNAAFDLSSHASNLNLTEGTVSFWAKIDSDTPEFSSILSRWVSASDESSFDLGYISLWNQTYGYSDELLSFVNGNRVWGGAWNVYAKLTRPDTFYKDGKWHAYSITMDNTKKLWLYVDGELQTIYDNWETLVPFFLSHNNNKIFVGKYHFRNLFLKWSIDEFKIYNYARTAAQIKSDYEQEAKPTVIIHYQNADGEELMSPTVHTTTSNGTEFQLGQTYYFDPDDLVSRADGGIYQKPEKQSVVFSQTERMKEITFVYPIKPMLVLHYTFDEGGNTVADSSQLETKNPGTVIGNYTWDEWGRVGGMYKKAQIMPWTGLGIRDVAAFTIGWWIKTTDKSHQNYFISNAGGADGYRFWISNGVPHFLLGNNEHVNPSIRAWWTENSCGVKDIADGNWHYLVWVFDVKGQKVTCYVDGVKDGERLLPRVYRQRKDIAPQIWGDGSYTYATHWNNSFLDDVRVYNYALSAQKVKELYDSFPAEETSAPVGLSLTTTSPRTTLVVGEKVVASANLDINRGGKNLKLVITVPKTLQPESNSISLLNWETVTSGSVNMVELSDKRVYTYYLKDNIKGQIKADFSVYFPWLVTDHLTPAKITAEIVKGDASLVNKELTFTAWAPFRLNMHWIHYTKPGNNYKVKYALNVYTETYFPWESPANFRFIDSKNPALYNFVATIPLPPKAKYISSSVNNGHGSATLSLTYDADKHAMIFRGTPRMDTLWNNRQFIELEYTGLQADDVIRANPMTFTGYLASPTGRIYTGSLNWVNQTVEAANANINLGFHLPQGSIVDDQDRQELFGLWIGNGWNTKVKNASVEFTIPEWIEVNSIRLPNATESNGNGHEVFWPHTINFDYWTNRGKTGSINGNYGAGYGKVELGLSDGEFIKKFVMKFPEINPWDTIPGMMGHANLGIRFNGDVKKIKVNGTPITQDTTLTMTGMFRAEWLPDRPIAWGLTIATKSYAPTYIQTFSHNWKNFTPGQTLRMRTFFWIQPGWHYNNGIFLKNPSLFLFIPRGFELDTATLGRTVTAGSATIWTPYKVTNQVANPPAGHEVWRIDITADLYPHSPNIYIDYNLKVTDSTPPWTYVFGDKAVLTTDNLKYQPWHAWAVGVKEDPYKLYGSPKWNYIIRWGDASVIITATELGNGVCSKTSVDDQWCKGSFIQDDLDTIYNYKSGGTGLLQTTLWNAGATVNNYTYTFRIPNVNTTNTNGTKNEWKPTIKSVEILGATGATHTETQEAHATLLKITIPTFASTDRPIINVVLQAPTFDDDQAYRNTYIDTYYTVNGTQKVGRTVGLRLVPSTYDPWVNRKYRFCLLAREKNENQGVSFEECSALFDFYRESKLTNGNWTNSNGWRLADDPSKDRKWYNETVTPICSWHGVICQNNKLVWLNLANNNLQRAFTGSFAKLKNLETLNLSENPNFNAEFKSEFKTSLAKLKEINLSSTKTKNLNNLPENLEKLTAQKLTLREIPVLPTELKELDLSNGDLNAVQNISPFFQAGKLEKLLLQNSKLRGVMPTSVNFQSTIKEINLSNNQFSGKLPSWVKNLTSQKVKLNFSDNYFIWPFPDWNVTFQAGSEIIFKNNYIHTLFADPNFNHIKNQLGNSRNYAPQYKLVATADGSSQALSELPNIRENWDARSFLIKKQVFTSREWGRSTDFVSEVGLSNILDTNIGVGRRWKVWFTVTLKRWFVTQFKVQTELTDGPEMTLTLKPSKDFQDENDPNKPQNQDKNMVWLTGQKNSLGTGLTFELKGKYLAQYFSAVHYSLWGNDIWWGFFWREVEDLANPVIISDGWTGTRTCYGRIRGFYYSSQRGERLWPLDQESKEQLKQLSSTYADLAMQWGRYTRCEGQENNIYGKIIHEYGTPTKKKYDLIAGVSYNVVGNKLTTPPALRCNFQRLNNAIPFGYIYDSAGGIGLLGASIKSNVMKLATAWDVPAFSKIYNFHNAYLKELENWKCVSDIFDHDGTQPHYNEGSISGHSSQILDGLLDFGFGSAQTTLFRLWIRGIIWLSSELSNNNRGSIEGNQAITSLLLNTDTSIAGVINLARQRAEDLCRNRRQPIPMGYQQLDPATDVDILCYDGALNGSSNLLHVDHYDVGKHRKKRIGAIAVKNADVWLNHTQWHSAPPVNLFIDKGDLLLPASSLTGELQSFNSEGYLLPANVPFWSGDSKAAFLRGNFIVNGLILWKWAAWYSPIVNKVIVHGKVASYNTYTTPTIEKRDSIRWILEAGRTIDEAKLNFIGLDQLFTRSCNSARGVGSDWTICEGVSADRWNSFITNKSFGLIDMDFPSPLFR